MSYPRVNAKAKAKAMAGGDSPLRLLCSSFAFGSSATFPDGGLAWTDSSSGQWASYVRH